jgi:signal transduction histidine kinase
MGTCNGPSLSASGRGDSTEDDGPAVEVAVLDRDGVIVSVNAVWGRFCRENGGDPSRCGVGASYLAVCEAAGDEASLRVAAAIRSAAAGLLLAPVRTELPCDTPFAKLRFEVFVSSRWADDGSCLGAVVASRPIGGAAFTEEELDQLAALADHLSLAIRMNESRVDASRLVVLEDRQRLARDLHDTVLQDVIAVGMQLDREAERTADPGLEARLSDIVQQLEAASQRLRGTVFELNEHRSTSFGEQAHAVVAAAVRVLGNTPTVTLRGDVEAVPSPLVRSAVAVSREALSNVARHSGATATEVTVEVDDGRLHLTVEDDGTGVVGQRVRGEGVANIRQRAALHGGTAEVGERSPRGTRVRWSVPLLP